MALEIGTAVTCMLLGPGMTATIPFDGHVSDVSVSGRGTVQMLSHDAAYWDFRSVKTHRLIARWDRARKTIRITDKNRPHSVCAYSE